MPNLAREPESNRLWFSPSDGRRSYRDRFTSNPDFSDLEESTYEAMMTCVRFRRFMDKSMSRRERMKRHQGSTSYLIGTHSHQPGLV